MAKIMRRIIIVAILLIALAAAAVFALYNCSAGTPFEGLRTAALNTAIDQAGIKDRVKSALNDKATEIAESYGLPAELATAGVNALAIDEWKVVDTPTDANETNTFTFYAEGSDVRVTLYDDPSVVSIRGTDGKLNTYGQAITFQVPETVQNVSELISYFQGQGQGDEE